MRTRWTLPLLLVFCLLAYLLPLGSHGLWIPDETRYAQISQGMLLSGDWVSPHFMGLRYFEKPIAGYWMIALSQAIFGDNLFGVRFVSALSATLSVLLCYLVAWRLWRERRKSFACALLYMSFTVVGGQAGYANLDPQFTFWVNLSLVALWFAVLVTQVHYGLRPLAELSRIAGQKAVVTKAKKSIAGFRVREEMPLGCKVTLRGDRMYEFLDRLIGITIPRIRDFRGFSPKAFDGRGNYSLGIKEQIVFPEIEYDKIDRLRGLDIVITTDARTDDEGRALLRAFQFPFK